jgi:fructosamine-3-kinase
MLGRVERLAGRVEALIGEAEGPSLVHGDVWSGNVLAREGRVEAFLDPAIYHADPEIELSYVAWTGTFGERFFRRYGELRPILDGFFEERRHLYALYPLLVHAYYFGGRYVGRVDETLRRFGA